MTFAATLDHPPVRLMSMVMTLNRHRFRHRRKRSLLLTNVSWIRTSDGTYYVSVVICEAKQTFIHINGLRRKFSMYWVDAKPFGKALKGFHLCRD